MADEPKPKRQRTRRGHGEGGITKRADGRWQASVDAGSADGRRRRIYAYRKTKKEAAEALVELKRQAKRELSKDRTIRTVEQFLDHWLDTAVEKTRAPKTVESYRSTIRNHISPHIGTKRLVALGRGDVQRMLDQVGAKDGVGPRSVQNARTVLRVALADAVSWGLIEDNPTDHAVTPRVETREGTPLTVEQAQTLFAQTENDRFAALYVIAAICGLRKGECLGLRWEDIDAKAGELRIRQQVSAVGGKLMLAPLKTKASRRNLPLLSVVAKSLDRRRKVQELERALAGSDWEDTGLIFTATKGGIFQPATLHVQWKKHLQRAGLPDVPFHSLRHTAASFMVALNVHPRLAQEILGHANVKTTLAIYSHAEQDGMRAALESIEGVLQKGSQ